MINYKQSIQVLKLNIPQRDNPIEGIAFTGKSILRLHRTVSPNMGYITIIFILDADDYYLNSYEIELKCINTFEDRTPPIDDLIFILHESFININKLMHEEFLKNNLSLKDSAFISDEEMTNQLISEYPIVFG